MTKKYNVIPIEDYYVVVDENPIDKGLVLSNQSTIVEVSKSSYAGLISRRFHETDKALVATIGKRIGQLPMIEMPNEAELAYYEYHNWDTKERTRPAIINMAKTSEFVQGYKAATKEQHKLYTEEDVWKAAMFGYDSALNNEVISADGSAETGMTKDDLMKYLKAKLPIIAVELELLRRVIGYSGLDKTPIYEKEVSLVIDENNIIHPVNIWYS